MKHKIGIATVAVGIALALGACGSIGSAGSAQANASNSANAAPSGNSAPGGATQGQQGSGGPAQGQRNPGVMGQVMTVNGSTITVQNQRQGGITTVMLNDSTQIFKQATVDLASVPVGKTLSAMGTLSGDVFTATQVRIGEIGANGPGGQGAPNGGRGGNGGSGAPGANGGAPQTNGTAQPTRERGSRLVGTVEQVSGDTITVKKADASTVQLKLGTNSQITEQVAGTTADITTGAQIAVRGQRTDTTVTATQVNVLPAMAPQP